MVSVRAGRRGASIRSRRRPARRRRSRGRAAGAAAQPRDNAARAPRCRARPPHAAASRATSIARCAPRSSARSATTSSAPGMAPKRKQPSVAAVIPGASSAAVSGLGGVESKVDGHEQPGEKVTAHDARARGRHLKRPQREAQQYRGEDEEHGEHQDDAVDRQGRERPARSRQRHADGKERRRAMPANERTIVGKERSHATKPVSCRKAASTSASRSGIARCRRRARSRSRPGRSPRAPLRPRTEVCRRTALHARRRSRAPGTERIRFTGPPSYRDRRGSAAWPRSRGERAPSRRSGSRRPFAPRRAAGRPRASVG